MKGDTRCIDGRLFRHDPQHDDPDLETDIGRCPECEGKGCDPDCDCCGNPSPDLSRVWAYGIETYACPKCRGDEKPRNAHVTEPLRSIVNSISPLVRP